MSDLRGGLERESERFDLAPGALERMLDRRRRKQTRHRVGAAAVALAVAGFGLWAVVSLGGLGKGPPRTPAGHASQLEGTWQTGRLSEQDVVTAFVAAGGTSKEGHAFFAQLGGGAKRYAVITLRFQGGTFLQFESADGGPPVEGYRAPYRVPRPGVVTIVNSTCTGTYGFRVEGRRLSLHVVRQCRGHDGPYNTTLFATFPLTRRG
jgi:hypothetical protein